MSKRLRRDVKQEYVNPKESLDASMVDLEAEFTTNEVEFVTAEETVQRICFNKNVMPMKELSKKKASVEAERERHVKNHRKAKASMQAALRKMLYHEQEIRDADAEIREIEEKINEDFRIYGYQ